MALEKINLGEYPSGKGGDNQRIASEKFNKAVDVLGQEATTTQKGVVQLNNTLNSNSELLALTAAMGRKLNDEKLSISGGEIDGSLTVNGLTVVNGTFRARRYFDLGYMETVNQERSIMIYSTGSTVRTAIRSRTNGALDFTNATSYSFDKAVKADLDGNAKTATKLATPRKINGVDFDGGADIETPVFGTTNGLVPARVGSTSNRYLNENGTWSATPNTNTTYAGMTEVTMQAGVSTANQLINAKLLKQAVEFWGTGVTRTYKDLVVEGNTDYKNNYSHDIWVSVLIAVPALSRAAARMLINNKSVATLYGSSNPTPAMLQTWIPSGATWRIFLAENTTISTEQTPQEYS